MRAELEDEGPGLHDMHWKLLVVWVRFMGHESRAGVKDGKDGESGMRIIPDHQVGEWCFPERRPSTELRICLGVDRLDLTPLQITCNLPEIYLSKSRITARKSYSKVESKITSPSK